MPEIAQKLLRSALLVVGRRQCRGVRDELRTAGATAAAAPIMAPPPPPPPPPPRMERYPGRVPGGERG